ncbi:EamA family transporter RarD [Rhodovibrionaceae bacterium A322]
MSSISGPALGLIYALLAYFLWGISPLYFKQLSELPAVEFVAHRIFWSVILLVVIISLGRNWSAVRQVIRNKRALAWLCVTTALISVNWLVFIWAIANDRILEASLGYYINPLVSVVLALIFLKERLGKLQSLAVGLATLGVLVAAFAGDGFPWISLLLALCFGFYGLIRKTISAGAVDGLFVETMLILPFALGYLIYLDQQSFGAFMQQPLEKDLLLILSGAMTALPLMFFAAAARRMSLSLVGVLQYVAPSLQFLIAVFIYDEPFGLRQLATFAFIWAGLIIFSYASLANRRRELSLKAS